jgi:hypothetical protein
MGHAGTAHGFDQGFFYNPALYVQGQLAGSLLGSTPAHTMRQTVDLCNLTNLVPLSLLRDRRGTVITPLGNTVHLLYFRRVIHNGSPQRKIRINRNESYNTFRKFASALTGIKGVAH